VAKNLNQDSSKIGSVIILRGIAALAVCFVHIALITNFHINRIIDFITTNGQQGVVIFFVISGFVLPYSLYKKRYTLADFFSFLIRRSVRIDPPYWFSMVIIFIAGILPVSKLNLNSVIEHLFYLVPFIKGSSWYSSVYWTLSIEFQFYILLGLFYPLLSKINANISVICLILISAVCIFMGFTYSGIIITNFYDFVFGYIVFFGYTKKISPKKTLLIILLFAVFVVLKVSFTAGFVPLTASLFIIFYKNNKLPKPVSFIGNISYSLYLLHSTTSTLFANYVSQFISNKLLLFPLCLVVSILIAYVFYRLIERPSMNLSKTLKM
jgi:peptidoglycan/LPS O-acetylase OafA/YrhL